MVKKRRSSSGGQQIRTLGFQEDVPRYRCCCNAVQAKTAALVIGIFGIVIDSAAIYFCFTRAFNEDLTVRYYYSEKDSNSNTTAVLVNIGPVVSKMYATAAGLNIVNFLAEIMLFIALCKQSQYFLVPKLVTQLVHLICYLAWPVALVTAMFVKVDVFRYSLFGFMLYLPKGLHDFPHLDSTGANHYRYLAIIFCVMFLFLAAVQIWAFSVIFATYRLFKEKCEWAFWIEDTKDIRSGSAFDPLLQMNSSTLPRNGSQGVGRSELVAQSFYSDNTL